MKIRSKLILLVTATFFLFAGAVGGYLVLLGPLNTIEKEREVLQGLKLSAFELQTSADQLLLNSIGRQRVVFGETVSRFRKSHGLLKEVFYLPSLNLTIQTAVNVISQLFSLSDSAVGMLESSLEALVAYADSSAINSNTVSILRLYRDGQIVDSSEDAALQSHVQDFFSALYNLSDALNNTHAAISKQETIIDEEIAKIKKRSAYLFVGSVMLIFLVGFLLSVLIARSISKALSFIQRGIARISSGDLRFRFNRHSKDEIGFLARDLDGFLETLGSSLREIQKSSHSNSRLKDALRQSVMAATSSATEIEANTSSIGNQMVRLDDMIKMSGERVSEISDSFERYYDRVSGQNQHIESSVSSVTQMLASIENIMRISRSNQALTSELVEESENGKDVFESSFEKVVEISDSISQIQDMADVIASIAAKTNVLAMNAAIEAAHAGEYGKGFAVVADEINKLATASADSSIEIAGMIKTIIAKIREAAETKEEIASVFSAVTDKVGAVSDSINGIYQNLDEVQSGSKQILEAMSKLRDDSLSISEDAGVMGSEAQSVKSEIENVALISHEVVSNIGEITLGLREITEAVQIVSENADTIGSVAADIDTALNRFVTET